MKVIKDIKEIKKSCALCLGNFDGLHKAHMKIIRDCIEYAKDNKLSSGALLFENHTEQVCKNICVRLITTLDEKLAILEEEGIDFVFIMKFDEALMKKMPEEFFDILINNLMVKALFAGFDYRFGYRAQGDADTLIELSENNGIKAFIADEIVFDNTPVSSTAIRELVKNGNIEKANLLLERNYSICGIIAYGKQNGRKMNYPTANIKYCENKLIPAMGVYAGFVTVDDKKYKSMINVGNNPTFNADEITIECHLLDFEGDIYEKKAKVEFVRKIRDEIKFNSPQKLIKQLKTDENTVRNILLI